MQLSVVKFREVRAAAHLGPTRGTRIVVSSSDMTDILAGCAIGTWWWERSGMWEGRKGEPEERRPRRRVGEFPR